MSKAPYKAQQVKNKLNVVKSQKKIKMMTDDNYITVRGISDSVRENNLFPIQERGILV